MRKSYLIRVQANVDDELLEKLNNIIQDNNLDSTSEGVRFLIENYAGVKHE